MSAACASNKEAKKQSAGVVAVLSRLIMQPERTLDHRLGRRDVLKPNGVADLGADLDLQENHQPTSQKARRLAYESWHAAC